MMLELLKRLAELDPELCQVQPSRMGISSYFIIGGLEFEVYPDGTMSDTFCDLLQVKLQRAIERRGWEYEHRYFAEPIGPRHRVIIMLGRDAGHTETTAAGALLAAYVRAMEVTR